MNTYYEWDNRFYLIAYWYLVAEWNGDGYDGQGMKLFSSRCKAEKYIKTFPENEREDYDIVELEVE